MNHNIIQEAFFKPSSSTNPQNSFCGYDTLDTPLTTIKYLSISNINDPIIPYLGGWSNVGVPFIDAEAAAFNIALNQGYNGSQLTSGVIMGDPQITEYSYLSGNVVHIKGNAAHGTNETQIDYLKDYFSDCDTALNINNNGLNKIKAHPNPTSSSIALSGLSNQATKYSIFNMIGQKVLSGYCSAKVPHINMSVLESQVYFLKIKNITLKVIKNK